MKNIGENMAQLKKDDIVLSFDNTSGRLLVVSTDGVSEWTHEPCALCRCLEAHPHGYEVGYEGWWRLSDLKKQKKWQQNLVLPNGFNSLE